MKVRNSILAALGVAAVVVPSLALAQAPSKIGIINMQAAMVQTKDGQKAAATLQSKFAPKQAEMEKKQQDVLAIQEQLRKGQNTLSEENKQKLTRDLEIKNTSLKRDTEDANADLELEQQKVTGELGGKIMSVLNKYATENGYALVLDVSNQQTPVMFAANAINITPEIVALYDKSTMSAPASVTPKSAAPKPPAAAPVKPGTK